MSVQVLWSCETLLLGAASRLLGELAAPDRAEERFEGRVRSAVRPVIDDSGNLAKIFTTMMTG